MIRKFLSSLVAASLMVLSNTCVAETETGPQQLQRFLQGLSTLTARFEQSVEDTEQGSRMHGHGMFYLRRPGQFRWDYQQPDQLIVADGKRIWLYDKELEQISHRDQENALQGTPAMLLSDTLPLQDNFEIMDRGHRNGLAWAELRPKYEQSEFARILLAFSDSQLQRMDIVDKFGNLTRFRFSRIQRNPELDPQLFHFRPPSGIDLFDF